jgi:hypothetical protein
MVVMNTATENKIIDFGRFSEQLKGRKQMQNMITHSIEALPAKLALGSNNILIAAIN